MRLAIENNPTVVSSCAAGLHNENDLRAESRLVALIKKRDKEGILVEARGITLLVYE